VTADDSKPAWLVNAGAAVGLVAGIVAIGYVLGAGVIAVRLFADKYGPDEVAGVIGELPREFVITLGFIEGLAVAASVGLILGLLASWEHAPRRWLTLKTIRVAATLFSFGCFVFIAFVFEGGWRAELWALVPPLVLSLAAGAVGAGVVSRAVDQEKSARCVGFLVGVSVMAIGMPLCVMFGPIVGFPDARVCLRGSDKPLTGSLVADTADSVVLLRRPESLREDETDRTVDTIPSDLVARLDFGDIDVLPPCEKLPPE
jgi:hypothetical protein